MTQALIELLKPIQDEYKSSEEWREIEKKAYPPLATKKKEKKVKNLGTRFPGANKDVETKPDGHVEGTAKGQVDLATDSSNAMRNLDIAANGT